MAADFSRIRLNPLLDYAGVELKQGAVLLDADANELVAIVDRRLRALASDTLGRATVSSTTPNAFKIAASGGSLAIQPGRLYVDGLLAECHGAASDDASKRTFDDLMAETVYTDPVDYADQPYLPSPPALPGSGRHLVYLDVWDREVTHLEQPDLVENALAVETSSRVQTVWQVRVLSPDAGTAVCGSLDGDLAGWSDVIAASSGVLSTGTYEVAPADNPCELPPTGGYRGLENQLYRIEIHDAGQPGGAASFKWSRENASVGSRVSSIVSGGELELETLGRDEVLRISSGDWVEILDDPREFSQSAGELRRVTVNDATRRITFSPPLPAAMLPGSFPNSDLPKANNLRVRRWDQRGKIYRTDSSAGTVEVQDLDDLGSSGAIKVPAAGVALLLENGITVSFDSNGSKGFKAGDWWVFAARTADASVERLDRASPRGIHHHYARLGVWDVAAGTVSDCRNPWPPATGDSDCGCTECVTPESHASGQLTIQHAVDRLQDTGGTVCLKTGLYLLTEPVHLSGVRSLTIRGQGPASVVIAPGTCFDITRSAAVVIEDLAVVSQGRQSAITVQTALGVAIKNLVILMLGDTKLSGTVGAAFSAGAAAVAFSGLVAAATVADNVIIASDGIGKGNPKVEGTPDWLAAAALAIEDNVLWCQRTGVALTGAVARLFETRIRGNQVFGCRTVGLCMLGLALPGAALRVAGNTLNVSGPGICTSGAGTWISDNKVHAVTVGTTQPVGSGILLLPGFAHADGGQCQILANQIEGFPDAGILIHASLSELLVKLNLIENCGNGILMLDTASADQLAIENNQLHAIGGTRSSKGLALATVGIGIANSDSAVVAGNVLRQVGVQITQERQLIAGIMALAVRRPRIAGNEATEIGPVADFGGLVAGILVCPPFRHTGVVNNHIERDSEVVLQSSDTDWYALLVGKSSKRLNDENLAFRIANFNTLRVDDTRTLVLYGNRASVSVERDFAQFATRSPPVSASLLGNVLIARGRAPAVDVTASEIQFNDNRCELRANQRTSAVLINTSIAIISANRVRGAEVSISVPNAKAQVAAIGNITTNGIHATLPQEMVPLNLIG